jgi:hypothetical protein
MGITAMKIWPFDAFAAASNGSDISTEQIKAGVDPFRKIRAAVGDCIDIMCEFHSLWNPRDSAQGVQIQPRTRSGSERRRMVNCRGAARPASDLGLPLPWPMRQYDE